jgi:glutamate--cysteine ligase
MSPAAPEDDRPVTRDELEQLFHGAEKPESAYRIGGEAEKFGVDATTFAPLQYDGPRGVQRIFDELVAKYGWKAEAETPGGPIIALTRGQASITLEPGAQLELSGAPHEDVHAVCAEMRQHLDELDGVSKELGLAWLGVGFHPLATQDELPWVPKHRYGIMRRYLPTRGARGLDMMRRTATVQGNFDYSNEEDAMRKLVALLRLSPLIHAMTACSPFMEGHLSRNKSERGAVWLEMDPSRSGLIPALWDAPRPRYTDYVEWALDAGMFLIRRGNTFIHNTGQTFRSFLADGFEGHRATFADWALHVNTLFPEARLKRTLEARSGDCLPMDLLCATPALLTGILYDAQSLGLAGELARRFTYAEVAAARPRLVQHGLDTTIGQAPATQLAAELCEIARSGLQRRARFDASGRDESVHLEKLAELVSAGKCPADRLLEGLAPGVEPSREEIFRRSRI